MSAGPGPPEGARAALSLTFDNLGEAAEVQAGVAELPAGDGAHVTATRVLPALLEELGRRGLTATFFVEGVNVELYPASLAAVAAAGHEVAYHSWCHEDWGSLSAAEQSANLARGSEAFARAGLGPAGMRPPGGLLGEGGVQVPADAGLRYASPAGRGAGVEGGLALLPFEWRHVDAACVLPGLDPAREAMTGSPEPAGPKDFAAAVRRSLEQLAGEGGYMSLVLHLAMLDWLGEKLLRQLLDQVAALAAGAGAVWAAPCRDVAAHVLDQPAAFAGGAELDTTSWTAPP